MTAACIAAALFGSLSFIACAQTGPVDQFLSSAAMTMPVSGRFCAEFEMQNTGSHVPQTMLIGVDFATVAWFALSMEEYLSGADVSGEYYSGDYTGIGLKNRPERNVDLELFQVGALVPALRTRVFLRHRDLVKSAERIEGGFDVRIVYPNDALRQITPNMKANIATSETIFH